ncbi:MAG: hypothetical protein IT164_16180 [Bryobacterales bacterium]|nr:hypothetical protein [Bryobacterales bacterium]
MAPKSCRYCNAPLAGGDTSAPAAPYCGDEHKRLYLERVQRDTIDRLRSTGSAMPVPASGVLHAGPPPGLYAAPPLRGPRREEAAGPAVTVIETATVTPAMIARATVAPEASLGALAEATAGHPASEPAAPAPPLHIEKTDNASLSNLLRQARDRIAHDPAPTSTALAIRRKARPRARLVSVVAAETASAPVKLPETQPEATPVRRVRLDGDSAPPALDMPILPEAMAPAAAASTPAPEPALQMASPAVAKPASECSIDVMAPHLSVTPATWAERIPWYAKFALVLALTGAGAGYWYYAPASAKAPAVRQAMDEVKPLRVTPSEWTVVKAGGAGASGRTLTLHKASMELTNYQVEFVGTVEHRALGWAVRVQDPANYYAAKLRLNPTGKARLSFLRWRVVDGVPGPETVLPLEMPLPSNEQYQVKVDVRDSRIVTSVQGTVIDRWTDETFSKGGFAYTNQNTERGKISLTSIGVLNAGGPLARAGR